MKNIKFCKFLSVAELCVCVVLIIELEI